MPLIKLNRQDRDEEVLINTDHIVQARPHRSGFTVLYLSTVMGDSEGFTWEAVHIKETLDDIFLAELEATHELLKGTR